MTEHTAEDSVAAIFMAEPGDYEVMALLLVASLRAFSYEKTAIYAYCRDHLIDQLHPKTRAFFKDHEVVLEPISPAFEVPYPQGNKMYACAAKRPERGTVLLDTDMFFLQPCFLSDVVRQGCVSGRRTADWMWGKTVQEWELAYKSVGLDPPKHRLARKTGSYVMPTISAGFVTYQDPKFGAIWRDVALEIEAKRLAKGIYPTLDQISLPVAVYKAGLKINMIERKWNRAGTDVGRAAVENVIAYHYQSLGQLSQTAVSWVADKLMEDFSEFASMEECRAFYASEGKRPSDVLKNQGAKSAVIEQQLKVDVAHNPKKAD